MAGFDNDTMYASNVDFSGGSPVAGQFTADGQMLIGATAAPKVRVGTLGSGTGINVVNGPGTATINCHEMKEYWFPAEGMAALETNFAPVLRLEGTNVNVFVRAFDASTEEYANGKLLVPSEVDTAGTVTFRAYVTAATAAASKNIGLTFGHLALNNSEDWDPASPYTEEDTGAVAIDATQDDVTEVTWTETVANLGWQASDLVLWRISRDVGVTDNLVGDMYLFSLTVEIPRSA